MSSHDVGWEHVLSVARDSLEQDPTDQERARAILRRLRGVAAVRVDVSESLAMLPEWHGSGRTWPGIPPETIPPVNRGGFVMGHGPGDLITDKEKFLGRIGRDGNVSMITDLCPGDVVAVSWWSPNGDPEWYQTALNVCNDIQLWRGVRTLTVWARELAGQRSLRLEHWEASLDRSLRVMQEITLA